MNKKFSTLMAGLMLASAFSVSAQGSLGIPTSIDKYEDGKYYVLGDGNNVLTVVSDAGPRYGELAMVWQGNGSDYWDLANLFFPIARMYENRLVIPNGKAGCRIR